MVTRIDYCNALYSELPDCTLAPLQRVLRAAALLLVGTRTRATVLGGRGAVCVTTCRQVSSTGRAKQVTPLGKIL